LKAFEDIKVQVANKKAKLADLQKTTNDPRYESVSHIYRILDKLNLDERKKLKDYLSQSVNREIPITKWHKSTGALLKAIIDIEVIFDENTTYADIQNDLLYINF
jgi:hypothetical protein